MRLPCAEKAYRPVRECLSHLLASGDPGSLAAAMRATALARLQTDEPAWRVGPEWLRIV